MKRRMQAIFFGLCLAVMSAGHTQADLVINIAEIGGNVVVNASGNVNTVAAMLNTSNTPLPTRGINPSLGVIIMGGPANYDGYNINVPLTPFGTLGGVSFDQTSGHFIGLLASPLIGVPVGYISGNPLSATGTFNLATFASLGITPGSYVTTFSNGGVSDTVTVNAVPEPSVAFLGLTAGVAGLFVRRRR